MDSTSQASAGRRHGLIFGKFLPFHAGHKRLVEFAQSQCDKVTVAVFSRDAEPIPGAVRAAWIAEECPTARVVHERANYPDPWDEVSWDYWVSACRRAAPKSTHLFTSETYGDELARRMRIEHVLVDRERLYVPVSGSAIRQDPIAHWRYVPGAVRPYLARKVAIVGAESTGKTTLASRLAAYYATVWVEEYGRDYCESHDIRSLTVDDLLAIATEQAALEDRMARQSNGLLICDTDLMVTRAWSQHLCGAVHPEISAIEFGRRYDLHLLTNLEVAWHNDGTRVCGDQAVRAWFHNRYVEELRTRNALHMQLPPREGDAFALAQNSIETLWPSLKP